MSRGIKIVARHLSYNRPSAGYKRNLARGMVNEAGLPKLNNKNILRSLKIALGIWAGLTLWAVIVRGMKGFVVWLVIGLICSFFILIYVSRLDKRYVRVYKELGITKERFFEELGRTRKLSEKQMKKLSRIWDGTKVRERPKAVRHPQR